MSAGNITPIAKNSRDIIPVENRLTGVPMWRSSSAKAVTASIRSRMSFLGILSDDAKSVTFS